MSQVIINGANLAMKYYGAAPVMTFEEIDMVHQRSSGSSRRNFTNNAQHLVEGVDYFLIPLNEYRDLYDHSYLRKGGNPTLRKTLLTVTGYCLLAKTFNDDLAWDIQRALVTNYFNADKDKGNIYEFLRQTIDVIESQAHAIQTLTEQVDIINQSISEKKQLQLELFEEVAEEKLIDSTQLAIQLGLFAESKLPHQMLVKSIARQSGIRITSDSPYEDDFVRIERSKQDNEINIIVVTVRFKAAAVKKIRDWFEAIKDYAYFEEFFKKNSKHHKAGELKHRGYRIGKRNYYIA